MPAQRLALQAVTHQSKQSVESFAHVGSTHCQINPCRRSPRLPAHPLIPPPRVCHCSKLLHRHPVFACPVPAAASSAKNPRYSKLLHASGKTPDAATRSLQTPPPVAPLPPGSVAADLPQSRV